MKRRYLWYNRVDHYKGKRYPSADNYDTKKHLKKGGGCEQYKSR